MSRWDKNTRAALPLRCHLLSQTQSKKWHPLLFVPEGKRRYFSNDSYLFFLSLLWRHYKLQKDIFPLGATVSLLKLKSRWESDHLEKKLGFSIRQMAGRHLQQTVDWLVYSELQTKNTSTNGGKRIAGRNLLMLSYIAFYCYSKHQDLNRGKMISAHIL